jgi:hypothetical protein
VVEIQNSLRPGTSPVIFHLSQGPKRLASLQNVLRRQRNLAGAARLQRTPHFSRTTILQPEHVACCSFSRFLYYLHRASSRHPTLRPFSLATPPLNRPSPTTLTPPPSPPPPCPKRRSGPPTRANALMCPRPSSRQSILPPCRLNRRRAVFPHGSTLRK